jgi:hypothetical protein
MNPSISPSSFDNFFAWSPLVIGVIIYAIFYVAKRHEKQRGTPIGQSVACAACGRKLRREHMTPIQQDGSIVWYCGHCPHPVPG